MITAGATPTPKTIDQRRVALTSPQVKTLQTDNAGTLARYSVPTRLIGSTVRLVQNGGRLLIAEPTGEVVADHPLTPPGEASVLDEHYDGPRFGAGRGPRPKTTTEQQFCGLGRPPKRSWSAPPRSATPRLPGECRGRLCSHTVSLRSHRSSSALRESILKWPGRTVAPSLRRKQFRRAAHCRFTCPHRRKTRADDHQ